MIPWDLYWEYGDITILESFAPMVERYADALLDIADGRVWPLRSWGDRLAPGHALAPEGSAPAATAMMANVLQVAARIMSTVGVDESAARYRSGAARTAAAYHAAYFDAGSGHYALPGLGYRQALNVLPLAFGLVPETHVPSVEASLVHDVVRRTKGHLDTGSIASRHLLAVLDSIGRADIALSIATAQARPGWGAWFKAGESTLMESWDETARSRSHYFLGGAFAWVYQRVGGLRASAPGWEIFDVDPIDDARVARGSLRHRSVRGEAAISWKRQPRGIEIELEVPPGGLARVRSSSGTLDLPPGRHQVHRPYPV